MNVFIANSALKTPVAIQISTVNHEHLIKYSKNRAVISSLIDYWDTDKELYLNEIDELLSELDSVVDVFSHESDDLLIPAERGFLHFLLQLIGIAYFAKQSSNTLKIVSR